MKLVRAGAGLEETFTYRLDNADRLTELTRVAGSRTDTVSYQYDNLDRVTKRLVNGEATEYSYDKSGRLQTILHKGQTTRYTWDAHSSFLRAGCRILFLSSIRLRSLHGSMGITRI